MKPPRVERPFHPMRPRAARLGHQASLPGPAAELVQHIAVSPPLFAIAPAATGLTLLSYGTNPTVSFLSAANIGIYAFMYTPMKRFSVINTWVGAIVGGIPPLMGWAAAAGETATPGHDKWQDLLFDPVSSAGGWLVAALLF